MIRHKKLTFQAGTYGRFIQKLGLTMTWVETMAIPFWMPRDIFLFVVSLHREGGPGPALFHYSKPQEDPVPPGLEEVLASLAHDALEYENAGGNIVAWGDIQGGVKPDDRDAVEVFKSVERDATELQKFLGVDAYMELLEISSGEFY